MRAAVLKSPREVVLSEIPTPEPKAGEVLVRLDGGGVCASEIPLWEGREWFRYPRPAGEPGHEGWGRIAGRGEGVTGVEVGHRVAVISQRAHADYDLANASHVVVLPDEIDPEVPFPGEPVACAANAVRRAGLEPGQRVAIVGCGFQGLLLVQLASRVGEVTAISRRPAAREAAAGAGARHICAQDDRSLEEGSFDVVFEATGHQEPLDLAARLARVRGRLVIVGYHQDGRRTVDLQLWNWRGLDVINAHEREPAAYVRGLREAIGAVRAGRLRLSPLLTHRYALAELNAAYATMARPPDGFVKAVWCRE